MNDSTIQALSLAISASIGFITAWISAKVQRKRSDQLAIDKLRNDLFRQIELQDQRIKHLEDELNSWKDRYYELKQQYLTIKYLNKVQRETPT